MKHVMIVEDQEDHAWILSIILTKLGFLPSTTLDLFYLYKQISDGKVDVVVLDIHLPGLTPGYEIVSHIRSFSKDIPIVMVTAAPNEDMRIDCLTRGANYYLVKPIDSADIKSVFKQYL